MVRIGSRVAFDGAASWSVASWGQGRIFVRCRQLRVDVSALRLIAIKNVRYVQQLSTHQG